MSNYGTKPFYAAEKHVITTALKQEVGAFFRLVSTCWEGHGVLPVIGSSRDRRRCSSSSPWFIDLGVQPIKGVIVRGGYRVVTMISMPWKGRRALGGRGAGMAMLKCTVGRWLRHWLRHWTHISVSEGLYSRIIGVCVVILNIWICRPAPATLLVSGAVLSQLRVPCLDSDRQMESQLRRLEIL